MGRIQIPYIQGTSVLCDTLYVYHCTANPLTDGLAVDWVNEKLYWTEATVSEVLVMDIKQQQKKTLIVNHNGSTTRAIAVDPTTR